MSFITLFLDELNIVESPILDYIFPFILGGFLHFMGSLRMI